MSGHYRHIIPSGLNSGIRLFESGDDGSLVICNPRILEIHGGYRTGVLNDALNLTPEAGVQSTVTLKTQCLRIRRKYEEPIFHIEICSGIGRKVGEINRATADTVYKHVNLYEELTEARVQSTLRSKTPVNVRYLNEHL